VETSDCTFGYGDAGGRVVVRPLGYGWKPLIVRLGMETARATASPMSARDRWKPLIVRLGMETWAMSPGVPRPVAVWKPLIVRLGMETAGHDAPRSARLSCVETSDCTFGYGDEAFAGKYRRCVEHVETSDCTFGYGDLQGRTPGHCPPCTWKPLIVRLGMETQAWQCWRKRSNSGWKPLIVRLGMETCHAWFVRNHPEIVETSDCTFGYGDSGLGHIIEANDQGGNL